MSEKKKFQENFERKRRNGLQDTKFCVKDGDNLQSNDFFAAANKLDDAIRDGRSRRMTSWERDVAPSAVAELA